MTWVVPLPPQSQSEAFMSTYQIIALFSEITKMIIDICHMNEWNEKLFFSSKLLNGPYGV